MKNYILFITVSLICLSSLGVNAQNHQIGLIGGINLANLDEKDEEYDIRTVFGVGGVFELGVGEKFAICFEPMYLQKGAKSEEVEDFIKVTIEGKFAYLEIPVFFKVPLGTSSTRPYIMAGPTIGILLSSNIGMSMMGIDIEVDTKDLTKSIDYGLGVGGGVSFPIGKNTLFIEARYTLGIADIAKEGEMEIDGEKETVPDSEVKTRGIQIMAGMSIPIGKK
ncbi:MAG: porin family protein [Candidatus Hodarchaeota archaeon]